MKILFISHEATKTGAPISLLNFLKEIKALKGIYISFFLLSDGPLENDFRKVSDEFYVVKEKKSLFGRILRKIIDFGEAK